MKIKIRRMIEQRSERRKNIGRKIKALREENGISIQRIADSLDMGEKNYIRIEEGKFSTSHKTLGKIAELLGTTLEGLMQD
jgi:transcriptional regulator with XRE-family HTH domain